MTLPIIVLDFDGTLTETDVGRAMCERYADPSWEKSIQQWLNGEITFREAQQQVWSTIGASRAELIRYAHTIGSLRAGADHLFEAAQNGLVELVLASGGFDLYIEELLGARIELFRECFYNELHLTERGIYATFPHEDLACKGCAVCKAKVIGRYIKPARRVLFCGDGSSDRCALSAESEIFAVRGSGFEEYCRTKGVRFTAFDDFRTVLARALSDTGLKK
jgi:2-hydroxy-3-keto-5-methylthiopentenyl-1-phosphate phosphatase